MAVDGGEDLGGGVVEADVADGGFWHAESGEGFSVSDCVGDGDGEGGFSGFGEAGEEDEGVLDEEGFGSVGAGVELEALRLNLLEAMGGGSAGAVGVAGERELLAWLLFGIVVFGPEVGVLGLVGVVVFDHHFIGDVFRGLSTILGRYSFVAVRYLPERKEQVRRCTGFGLIFPYLEYLL